MSRRRKGGVNQRYIKCSGGSRAEGGCGGLDPPFFSSKNLLSKRVKNNAF